MTKLTNAGITTASQITGAIYSMRLEPGYGGPATIGTYYYPGTAWTESTIKCSQVSWSVGALVSTTAVNASSGYIGFNILAAVQSWKASPGLMIRTRDWFSKTIPANRVRPMTGHSTPRNMGMHPISRGLKSHIIHRCQCH